MNKQIEEIIYNIYPGLFDNKDAVQAISNLLDQEMVKFAEWIGKNLYGYGGNDNWIKTNKITKTSELLTLYKAKMNKIK